LGKDYKILLENFSMIDAIEKNSMNEGPVRLFIGGVHGSEGSVTAPLLKEFSRKTPKFGKNIIIPYLVKTRYISTLKKEYWETDAGIRLMKIIRKVNPRIYVEVHCYVEKAYKILTDPERLEKRGIYPLLELEDGILFGSVSPLIRKKLFSENDGCFLIEVPREKPPEKKVLKILEYFRNSSHRTQIMRKMRGEYKNQMEIFDEFHKKFYE
jgi:hypothetical protein